MSKYKIIGLVFFYVVLSFCDFVAIIVYSFKFLK